MRLRAIAPFKWIIEASTYQLRRMEAVLQDYRSLPVFRLL